MKFERKYKEPDAEWQEITEKEFRSKWGDETTDTIIQNPTGGTHEFQTSFAYYKVHAY